MSADRAPNIAPDIMALYRQMEAERMIAQGICPDCRGSLDTGWMCNHCGADFYDVAFNMPDERYDRFAVGA